jgi:hypothetical protein
MMATAIMMMMTSLDISRTVRRDPLTCSDGAHSLHHLVMPLDDTTVASSQLTG